MNNSAARLMLYAYISSIEIDMRDFLEENITEENVDSLINEELLKKIKNRSSEEFDFQVDHLDFIEYLDFGDIVNLISKIKKYFPKGIQADVSEFISLIEDIIPIRNRVMHSRPFKYDDYPKVNNFISSTKKFSFIQWSELNDAIEQLKKDPSLIFTYDIPEIEEISCCKIFHNLPQVEFDDTGFVGREKDLKKIKDKILGTYNVISVIGEGGIGKTAIVQQCLYDLIDDNNTPFECIVWVSLKTRQLNNGEFKNIKNAVCSTLTLYSKLSNMFEESKNESIESMLEVIYQNMKDIKILLVLDNLETINTSDIHTFFENIPMNSKVLLTSRIGLGEFEDRYILKGFEKKERLYYMRRLAQFYQINSLKKIADNELDDICKQLYSNPLSMKWFIMNLKKGYPIESVLQNKGELIEFCMSNVYDKLCETSKKIIACLMVFRNEIFDAELDFLLDIEMVERRQALNELLRTNMLNMNTKFYDNSKTVYKINEFAYEYLKNNHGPDKETFLNISKKMKRLKGLKQNLSLEVTADPFDPASICNVKSRDEVLAAYNLKQALYYSKSNDFICAKKFINKAKEISPNFEEVYKVSAFINSEIGDYFGAEEDYQTALNCNPESPYILFLYAGFKVRFLDEFEEAIEIYNKIADILNNSVEVKMQRARALMLNNNFEEAAKEFLDTLGKIKTLIPKKQRVFINYTAENYRRHAEYYIKIFDYDNAIESLNSSINLFIDYKYFNFTNDRFIAKTIAKIMNEYLRLLNIPEIKGDIIETQIIKIIENFTASLVNTKQAHYIEKSIDNYSNNLSNKTYNLIYKKLINPIDNRAKNIKEEFSGIVVDKCENFGFISNYYHRQLYFNSRTCKSNFSDLKIGTEVDFELSENFKGKCAINIFIKD
jgi:Tfp pilus assembly protein PilF/cold shock CspA family protein